MAGWQLAVAAPVYFGSSDDRLVETDDMIRNFPLTSPSSQTHDLRKSSTDLRSRGSILAGRRHYRLRLNHIQNATT